MPGKLDHARPFCIWSHDYAQAWSPIFTKVHKIFAFYYVNATQNCDKNCDYKKIVKKVATKIVMKIMMIKKIVIKI